MEANKRLFGFDLARATAIGLVLICHFGRGYELLGFLGVEIFFALSGFLIGGILYRTLFRSDGFEIRDVWTFWRRRWWRTLPNYYLFLVVAVGVGVFIGGIPNLWSLIRYFFFLQFAVSPSFGAFFYGVSWSLCVEEFFYLLLPICLYVGHLFSRSRRRVFLWVAVAFIIIPILIRLICGQYFTLEELRKFTPARLDAIFFGVLMAFVVQRVRMTPFQKRGMGVVGMIMIGVSIFLFEHSDLKECSPWNAVCLFGLPAMGFALCLPVVADWGMPGGIFTPFGRAVVNISLWSYSIYLAHIPVLWVIYELFGSSRDTAVVNLVSKLVAFGIVIAVSAIVYRFFERPLTAHRPPEAVNR